MQSFAGGQPLGWGKLYTAMRSDIPLSHLANFDFLQGTINHEVYTRFAGAGS
jgi:hypothetical protein